MPIQKAFIVQNALIEGYRRLNSLDFEFRERAFHAGNRFVPVPAERDEFRDERVVMRRHPIAGVNIAINADTDSPRRLISRY